MLQDYDILADLLEYPDTDWDQKLVRCNGLAGECSLFYRAAVGVPLATMQEQYTQTFDLNPVCTLEVGYHLFGENYKRGVFLANLRETESAFCLGQDRQLPDYLPVLLRLLVRLEDTDLRNALISDCMVPALGKMIEAVSKRPSVYRHLLEAVQSRLSAEMPGQYANARAGNQNPAVYPMGREGFHV